MYALASIVNIQVIHINIICERDANRISSFGGAEEDLQLDASADAAELGAAAGPAPVDGLGDRVGQEASAGGKR